MKTITNNSGQNSTSKSVIKINILYIIAFQLLGLTTALFSEYQLFETNSPEINLASENTATITNDFITYQICTPETCKNFGP